MGKREDVLDVLYSVREIDGFTSLNPFVDDILDALGVEIVVTEEVVAK